MYTATRILHKTTGNYVRMLQCNNSKSLATKLSLDGAMDASLALLPETPTT